MFGEVDPKVGCLGRIFMLMRLGLWCWVSHFICGVVRCSKRLEMVAEVLLQRMRIQLV